MQPKIQTEHKGEHNGESEDLAERLRELYKIYECEQELPVHDELVAKLDSANPEVREYVQEELDIGLVYPYTKKEARVSLPERVIILSAGTLLGGLKVFPLLLKSVFSKELSTETANYLNYEAKKIFEDFKANIEYDLEHPED